MAIEQRNKTRKGARVWFMVGQTVYLSSSARGYWQPHSRRTENGDGRPGRGVRGYIKPHAQAGTGKDFLRRMAAETNVMTRNTGKGSRNVMEML